MVKVMQYFKTFDKVSHQHLCHKLYHYGIWGNTLEWIKDFLTRRQQQVLVNGEQNNANEVTSGVLHGTIVAPLLFLCFINAISCQQKTIFADDVILYTSINYK